MVASLRLLLAAGLTLLPAISFAAPTPQDSDATAPTPKIEELEGILKAVSLSDIDYDCGNNDANYQADMFEKHEVPKYLRQYLLDKIPKEELLTMGKETVPFCRLFANEFKRTVECKWGTNIELPECQEWKDDGHDARAWLVLAALKDTGDFIRNFYEDFDSVLLDGYINRGEIIQDATKHFPHDQRAEMAKKYAIIGIIGSSLSWLSYPGAVIGGTLGAIASSKDLDEFFDIDQENRNLEYNLGKQLSAMADTYRGAAEDLFKRVLHHGDPSGILERPMRSNMAHQEIADDMERFLNNFKPFRATRDLPSQESRRTGLQKVMARYILAITLKETKHFVVKNNMPALENLAVEEWKDGCNRMKGGWADEVQRACYTLQAPRLGRESKAPWVDHAYIATKFGDQKYDMSLEEFYKNADLCAASCPDAECHAPDNVSMTSFKLPECLFNLPVLYRYSVCDTNRQPNFPYYFDGQCHEVGIDDVKIDFAYSPEAWEEEMNKASAGVMPCDEDFSEMTIAPGCGNG